MSDYGDHVSTSSEVPRELLVSVQLYISTAMEMTLRKVCLMQCECMYLTNLTQPVPTRKKSDLKRESAGGEDNKLKGHLSLTSQMNDRF